MKNAPKIQGTPEAWESEELGADEAHAHVSNEHTVEIESALELQPISIRLQKGLLEDLKAIARLNGLGYQPLVRQVLTRFVTSEMKLMLAQRVNEQAKAPEANRPEPRASKLKKAA